MPDDRTATLIQRQRNKYIDLDADFWPLYEKVREYTLTSVERLYDLYKTVEHISKANVPGDIIECGVWKGGSMMMAALALQKFGNASKSLYLYDTFEGMTYPDSDNDLDILGNHAADRYRDGWIKVSEHDVEANMASTNYPTFTLIKGAVEETLPKLSNRMHFCIVRLDTDWEASTRVELHYLWPLLAPGGFLIIDDYGHWQGVRAAVDDYFKNMPVKMFRIDYSCRIIQKGGLNVSI